MSINQNVSTFTLSSTTPPVSLEIRTIVSESHFPGHNVKTPPSPLPKGDTPASDPNRNNFHVTATVTNYSNGTGNLRKITSDLNASLRRQQSATSSSSPSKASSLESLLAPATPGHSPMSERIRVANSAMPSVPSQTMASSAARPRRERERESQGTSQHCQGSDISNSCARGPPGDKISDYKGIWTSQTISPGLPTTNWPGRIDQRIHYTVPIW
jgi:hypothetical protein